MNDKDRVNRVYERYSHKHIRILLPDVIHSSRVGGIGHPPTLHPAAYRLSISGSCATKFIHKSVISGDQVDCTGTTGVSGGEVLAEEVEWDKVVKVIERAILLLSLSNST